MSQAENESWGELRAALAREPAGVAEVLSAPYIDRD